MPKVLNHPFIMATMSLENSSFRCGAYDLLSETDLYKGGKIDLIVYLLPP